MSAETQHTRLPHVVAGCLFSVLCAVVLSEIAFACADERQSTLSNHMLAVNAQHTGYVTYPGPMESPRIIFQAPTGFKKAVFDMAPTLDVHGNLYSDLGSSWRADAQGRTGGVIAVDGQGRERWRRNYPDLQYGLSVPAITPAGLVVMGFRDGWVRAFQAADGTIAWAYHLENSAFIAAPLVDPDGDIYISSLGQGGILKLDGKTGAELWRLPFASGSGASPALSHDGKTVYAGWAELQPGLYAIDPHTGKKKWQWKPERECFFDWCSPVVAADGTLYQQNEKDGTLYALEDLETDARLKWSYTPKGEINDAPRTSATDGAVIYLGASGTNPRFTALSQAGGVLWEYEIPGKAEMAGIVVNDQAVYFPVVVPDGGAGWVYALEKKSGQPLWREKVTHDDSDMGGITLAGSGVLYAGTSGTVDYPYEGVMVGLK